MHILYVYKYDLCPSSEVDCQNVIPTNKLAFKDNRFSTKDDNKSKMESWRVDTTLTDPSSTLDTRLHFGRSVRLNNSFDSRIAAALSNLGDLRPILITLPRGGDYAGWLENERISLTIQICLHHSLVHKHLQCSAGRERVCLLVHPLCIRHTRHVVMYTH